MSNGDSDVLVYIPFKKEVLDENDIKWINSFQSILETSLQQITKHVIRVAKSFSDEISTDQKPKVIVVLLPNVDFEDTDEQLSGGKRIIQVNCHPDINKEISKESFIVNLYDEVKNNPIDITGHIHELKNEIWLKFLDIAYEIREAVTTRKGSKRIKGKIFVAETSSEQNINRETIIRELEHLGYNIFPDKHFPRDMNSFSELVHSSMKECFLSIHIIGNFYAPLIENVEISSIELQNDLFHEVAAEVNIKGQVLKRLVWIPPDVKPKSEKQKLYIESFKRNIELLKNTEIIQTPIEVFKTIIEGKAQSILESKTTKEDDKKNTSSVYLISNNLNSDHYNAIKSMLLNHKLEIMEVIDTKNKIELVQNHYYNLINCDALLIDYSVSNPQWLNSKLSDVIKSPGFGRKKDFIAKSILLNTEETPKLNIKVNNLDIINNHKKDINQRLISFIEKINKNDT